ncbi:MAG: hypothetical protein IKN65_02710 [Clostridia bacterium]|nr:hypothetical protein [Clostridia bacterium]
MNQILLTNEETGKSSNGMKPVIRFFAVVAIVFAIVLIVEGILHLYNNLNKRNDYSKPQLSYEKNGSSINLKVDGEIGLNKVTYSWNDGNETVLSADGRKSVSYNIEIPQGDSTLKAVVKDVEGHETKFEDIEISFNESDDTVKPEIKIENVSGKLEVTATDEKEIDYLTYQWEGADEVRIEQSEEDKTKIVQTIEVEKGTKKLTLVAVDKTGNKQTVTKKIIGSNGPAISASLDGDNFVIKVTDEFGITKIEYTHNDEQKTVEGIPENAKEFEFRVPLKDGVNLLKINAYENGIMTEYKCKKTK